MNYKISKRKTKHNLEVTNAIFWLVEVLLTASLARKSLFSNLVGENTVTWVLLAPAILCSAYQGSCFSFIIFNIVSRGDRLEKPANIKVENNGAVGYVGSSLAVHNPLFFGHKL